MLPEACIVYEDHDLIVCYKRAGLAVQSARTGQMDLESELKNRVALLHPGKVPYIAVVHRLDQPVAGLLVFGKTKKSAAALSEQAASELMQKSYLALVEGAMPVGEKRELTHYLVKEKNLARISHGKDSRAKKAVLDYEVLQSREGRSLLRIALKTGRFHQIRCQLAGEGHPVAGDRKYGAGAGYAGKGIALCAAALSFRHPVSGELLRFSLPEEEVRQNFRMEQV